MVPRGNGKVGSAEEELRMATGQKEGLSGGLGIFSGSNGVLSRMCGNDDDVEAQEIRPKWADKRQFSGARDG